MNIKNIIKILAELSQTLYEMMMFCVTPTFSFYLNIKLVTHLKYYQNFQEILNDVSFTASSNIFLKILNHMKNFSNTIIVIIYYDNVLFFYLY